MPDPTNPVPVQPAAVLGCSWGGAVWISPIGTAWLSQGKGEKFFLLQAGAARDYAGWFRVMQHVVCKATCSSTCVHRTLWCVVMSLETTLQLGFQPLIQWMLCSHPKHWCDHSINTANHSTVSITTQTIFPTKNFITKCMLIILIYFWINRYCVWKPLVGFKKYFNIPFVGGRKVIAENGAMCAYDHSIICTKQK